jgi:hypothetical protein
MNSSVQKRAREITLISTKESLHDGKHEKLGTTHFTNEEIQDIVELGSILRRIHDRLVATGKLKKETL